MPAKRRVAFRAEVVPARLKRAQEEGPEPAAPRAPGPPPAPRDPTKGYWRLFLKKPVDTLIEEGTKRTQLKRTLGPLTLTLLGIGGIIGTGIFVLTGVAASKYAGNMIWVAFVLAGIVATLAALSYAELASMLPVSGSAYTYAYASVGELVAWVIAWDLILEYAVGAMTVAQGWSGYMAGLLAQGGIEVPRQWLDGPLDGGIIDVPAVLIVLGVTALLVYGIQESANVTNALVVVKVGIIVFVILLGFLIVRGIDGSSEFDFYFQEHVAEGFGGVITAAGLVFFAYIGFDALSTTAEETKNPKRDLPIGILGSLAVSTLLYILASMVIVRIMPYDQIDPNEPFGFAFQAAGLDWAAAIVRVSAVAGITSVLIVLLMSQPRIFFSMARDGLLPAFIAKVHPRFRTPWIATILTGVVVAIVGGLLPIGIVALVTNIGTLFAFLLVGVSVIILRYTNPDTPRGYKVPGPPWLLPGLGAASALALMAFLPGLTWLVFLFWLGVGLVIYAAYGYYKSKAFRHATSTGTPPSS